MIIILFRRVVKELVSPSRRTSRHDTSNYFSEVVYTWTSNNKLVIC